MYASSRPAFTDFMLNATKESIIFDIAKDFADNLCNFFAMSLILSHIKN